MNKRALLSLVVSMVLLFAFIGSLGFLGVASGDKLTGSVSYEYYVVAGYEMEPVPPSPASSPSGFEFDCTPDVFNFGNITKAPGKEWLYEGIAGTPFGSAYASVNITNLLGYDITVTNLTIEVTDGTPSLRYYFRLADMYFSNYTTIMADILDPWDEATPPKYRIDECNYTSGEIMVIRDGDWTTMAVGIPEPRGEHTTGPLPLLTIDWEGDANTTGHVAPVTLAAGATLTEYFGIPLFGDNTINSQIDATFTLTLMYEYEIPGSPEAVFDYTPADPLAGEVVTFDASDSIPNGGNITSYVWDFGDGASGTGMIANHTYTSAGAYTVSLNVTDSEGLSDTASETVTIGGPPSAAFSFTPDEPAVDETVSFDASGSTPDGGSITSYAWTFGDGETGSGETVNHAYSEAGTYTVTLNVTDSRGLWDTSSDSVTVVAAEEFPWIWVGVGGVIIVVIVAAAVFFLRRK